MLLGCIHVVHLAFGCWWEPFLLQLARSYLTPTCVFVNVDIQRDCMAKYGFQGRGAVMAATMQIQMHSMSDPEMMQDVQFMMAKLNGR